MRLNLEMHDKLAGLFAISDAAEQRFRCAILMWAIFESAASILRIILTVGGFSELLCNSMEVMEMLFSRSE